MLRIIIGAGSVITMIAVSGAITPGGVRLGFGTRLTFSGQRGGRKRLGSIKEASRYVLLERKVL